MLVSSSTYTSFGYEDKMVRFARGVGVPVGNGVYRFDLAEDVPSYRYLRVIDPCTTDLLRSSFEGLCCRRGGRSSG